MLHNLRPLGDGVPIGSFNVLRSLWVGKRKQGHIFRDLAPLFHLVKRQQRNVRIFPSEPSDRGRLLPQRRIEVLPH